MATMVDVSLSAASISRHRDDEAEWARNPVAAGRNIAQYASSHLGPRRVSQGFVEYRATTAESLIGGYSSKLQYAPLSGLDIETSCALMLVTGEVRQLTFWIAYIEKRMREEGYLSPFTRAALCDARGRLYMLRGNWWLADQFFLRGVEECIKLRSSGRYDALDIRRAELPLMFHAIENALFAGSIEDVVYWAGEAVYNENVMELQRDNHYVMNLGWRARAIENHAAAVASLPFHEWLMSSSESYRSKFSDSGEAERDGFQRARDGLFWAADTYRKTSNVRDGLLARCQRIELVERFEEPDERQRVAFELLDELHHARAIGDYELILRLTLCEAKRRAISCEVGESNVLLCETLASYYAGELLCAPYWYAEATVAGAISCSSVGLHRKSESMFRAALETYGMVGRPERYTAIRDTLSDGPGLRKVLFSY